MLWVRDRRFLSLVCCLIFSSSLSWVRLVWGNGLLLCFSTVNQLVGGACNGCRNLINGCCGSCCFGQQREHVNPAPFPCFSFGEAHPYSSWLLAMGCYCFLIRYPVTVIVDSDYSLSRGPAVVSVFSSSKRITIWIWTTTEAVVQLPRASVIEPLGLQASNVAGEAVFISCTLIILFGHIA